MTADNRFVGVKVAIWVVVVAYVLCPLASAWNGSSVLSYLSAENERFLPGVHESLQTENRCRLDDCDDITTIWRDRRTGSVFREQDFREHRRAEVRRLGIAWFVYGAIACFLAAWYRYKFFGERFEANFVLYLIGNMVMVAVILINLPT